MELSPGWHQGIAGLHEVASCGFESACRPIRASRRPSWVCGRLPRPTIVETVGKSTSTSGFPPRRSGLYLMIDQSRRDGGQHYINCTNAGFWYISGKQRHVPHKGSSIPLLFAASAIASHVNILSVWVTAVGLFVLGWALQILGHRLFEGNRPTLLDNPVQMLISPMYIFAKLFVALGLRPDLEAVLQKSSQQTPLDRPHRPVGGRADVGKTS